MDGLLLASWEARFFGGVGVANPFAPSACTNYSILQDMLEGSDPRDPFGCPNVPAVNFNYPVVNLVLTNNTIELHFQWPAVYVGRFNFGVRQTTALGNSFIDLPVTGPINVAGNEFKMTANFTSSAESYFYLTVSLQ